MTAVRRTALAGIAGLALGGCRTTHELGPVSDPATVTHLLLGLPAFAIGAAAGAWLAMNTTGCGCEGSEDPSPFQWGLAFGALSGLAGAIVGAGAGALLTHEDRYVLARP